MITSPKNPKITAAARLHKRALRDQERRFLVEGARAVGEALRSAAELELLFYSAAASGDPAIETARGLGVELQEVGTEAMERLTGTVTPQGLVGVSSFVDVRLDELPAALTCVAVICSGRDPGNAGTVLRSADAAGADAVVFAGDSVDPYNPKTVRSSAGSLFHLPLVRNIGIEETVAFMRAHGMRVYAAGSDGEADLYSLDLTRPCAFVFGNEAWGLPEEVEALADLTVRVPICGKAESLNLAAAAAVCLFETVRQRTAGGSPLESIIAGAAHDIRSPLTAARNFAAVLLQAGSAVSEEDREAMLQGIVHDADQTDRILRQLVDAARIVGGRLELAREVADVGEIVGSIAADAAFDPDHPEVVWKGGLVKVRADPARLRLALSAFVEAAVWWASQGPVEVDATSDETGTRIQVSRGHAAVPPGEEEALFVPRKPGTGSGSKIGLFVARGIAEAHGGTAEAGVDGQGLHLRLHLPR